MRGSHGFLATTITRHPAQVANLSADATVLRVFRFGLRVAIPPKLCCDSPQLSPLRLATCLMVSALLDADMPLLIDRSACLVEPVAVELLAPPVLVLSPQQALPTPRQVAAHETHREASLSKVLSLLRAAHSELLLSPRCIGSSDRAD